tara:strand:- start:3140 stop:4738 length:1599 start_codon:yes stop_codon:yes gene_type:complete
MTPFAALFERLQHAPSAASKQRWLTAYFDAAPDPDRGWAVALLTGALTLKRFRPAELRALLAARVDPELFAWSHAHVGDLVETVALLWPARPGANRPPDLSELVNGLRTAEKADLSRLLAGWLDGLDSPGRWTLLKLACGALRLDLSARLVKRALAEWGGRPLAQIEEVWHGLTPPYGALFAWLAERREGPAPVADPDTAFRPMMRACALQPAAVQDLDLAAYQVEWKWTGVRVQLLANGPRPSRLFSQDGDDLSAAFPDLLADLDFTAVIDGQLLVAEPADLAGGALQIAPLAQLQQRLTRKRIDKKLLAAAPAYLRAFDLLFDGTKDLRPLSLAQRRARLERCLARQRPARLDLSPLAPVRNHAALAALRAEGATGCGGLVLKRKTSAYLADAPQGAWLVWRFPARTVKAVLLYVERGRGRSARPFARATFGAWRATAAGRELVPLGAAACTLPDDQLARLESWVKANSIARFGPVRSVTPSLLLEVAFEAVDAAPRRKAGLTLRAPRLLSICWEADADQAVRLESLRPV